MTIKANVKCFASFFEWLLLMLMNDQVTIKEAEEKLSDLGVVAEPEEKYGKI